MSAGSIIQVTLWNSPYLGNVMLSELILARRVREELGLGTHFVLAPGSAGQPWLSRIEGEGATWSILPGDSTKKWRGHLDDLVREHGGKLIHTHFTEADLQAASVSAKYDIPCIWHLRTGFTGYPLGQRLKDLLKLRVIARRRVARLIAVSPWLAELAKQRGAPPGRVEVVPNAIAAERFADPPSRTEARERFGLDPDALVVLCLGWWPEIKGVDLYLDALASLAERHPRMNALLVGEERMRDFLAEHWPQRPSWLHTSGFVDNSAWLFSASDIFVSSSRAEGQSSAVGEALACGVPVVMSDIPGTSVWKPAPGLLTFHSEDTAGLAKELERLLEEPTQVRYEMGLRSREWLEDNFSLELWCDRICAIYRELL